MVKNMKKHFVKFIVIIICIVLTMQCVSCGSDPNTPEPGTEESEVSSVSDITTTTEAEKTETTDTDESRITEEPDYPESVWGPIKSLTLDFYDERCIDELDYNKTDMSITVKAGDKFSVRHICDPEIYDSFVCFEIGDPAIIRNTDRNFVNFFGIEALAEGTSDFTVYYKSTVKKVTVHVEKNEEETTTDPGDDPLPPTLETVSIIGPHTVDVERGAVKYEFAANIDEALIGSIVWDSSNKSVATIAGDGTLTPIAQGTTTVTLNCDGVTDSLEVSLFYDFKEATYDLQTIPEVLNDSTALLTYTTKEFVNAFLKTEEFYALEKTPENVEKAKALIAELSELWSDVLDDASLLKGVASMAEQELGVALHPVAFKASVLSSPAQSQSEWANELTKKFDSYKGAGKIRQLADDMGCDAQKAYKALTMAQDIIKGEAIEDEFFWETCEIVADATKTSCKVGVAACAICATAGVGATAVSTTAVAKTGLALGLETGGMVVTGIDALLEVGTKGSKIILGEDHEVSVALDNTASDFSNVSFVFGLATYNSSETVDRVLFLADNFTNLLTEGKIGSINVDKELGKLAVKLTEIGENGLAEDKAKAMGIENALKAKEDVTAEQINQKYEDIGNTEEIKKVIDGLSIENKENMIEDYRSEIETAFDEQYLINEHGLLTYHETNNATYYVDVYGRKQGKYFVYNYGRLSRMYTYSDDVYDGPFEEYVNQSDGTYYKSLTGSYKNGVLDGTSVAYNKDGEKTRCTIYKGGVAVDVSVYYTMASDNVAGNNAKERHTYWENGISKETFYYTADGVVYSTSTYDAEGQLVQSIRYYYGTSKISEKTECDDHGYVMTYYAENGKIMEKRDYPNERPTNCDYYKYEYYEDGTVLKEEGWVATNATSKGVWKYYKNDGTLYNTYDFGGIDD